MYTKNIYYKYLRQAFWLQDSLCEFTTQEPDSNDDFVFQNRFWTLDLKNSCTYTKINLSKKISIW